MAPLFELRLFGAPQLLHNAAPVRFKRRKCMALLAYLAMAERPQTRERIASILWPETDSPHALGSLRLALHALGPAAELVAANRDTVAFRSDRCAVDAGAFLELTSGSAAEADTRTLEKSASMYNDDFLRGFSLKDSPEFDDWLFFTAESLQTRLARVLAELVDRFTPVDTSVAVGYAQRLVRLEELDEDHHRALIDLYVTEGRYAAAIRQFERCREVLARELGEEPSRDLAALYERIRGRSDEVPSPSERGSDYLPSGSPTRTDRRVRNRSALALAFVMAAALFTTGTVLWRRSLPPRIPAITVLPFAYLAVEEARPQLASQISRFVETCLIEDSGLAVKRARTEELLERGTDELRRYGRRHGVDYLVDGSVLDQGDEVSVTVQLVDVAAGDLLLGNEFHAGELDLGIELTYLAQTVTEEVYGTLGPELQEYLLSGEVLLNPWCETSYLLTRYHSETNLSEADRARLYVTIKENLVDPYVCEGYFLNADTYWATGLYGIMPPEPAGELLRLAIEESEGEIDIPERDLARGIYALYYEHDAQAAANAIANAYRRDPTSVQLGRWWALMLALGGDYQSALAVLADVQRYSPHDPAIPIYRATFLYKAGRYDESVEAAEVSIERNNRWIGLTQAGKALIQLGRLDEAITTLEEAVRLQETMQEPRAYLAHATALRGNTIRARQLLSELRATPNGDPSRFASPALEAVAEIGLDRRGQALALLADAVESGDPALWLVHDDPVLDRIHSEFAAMVRLPAVDAIAGRPVGRE